MKKLINGEYIEMTPEEIEQLAVDAVIGEKLYWSNITYDDAVNAEIRKKYTESAEFALLRQKDEKPTEYNEYYTYCEECKEFVKLKMGGS